MGLDGGCFIMLCSFETEGECLEKKLFGAPKSLEGLLKDLDEGDIGFLFNYSTNTLLGVFEAQSKIDTYDNNAWNGKFLAQFRIQPIGEIKPVKNATKVLKTVGIELTAMRKENRQRPKWPIQPNYITKKLLEYFPDSQSFSEKVSDNLYSFNNLEQPLEQRRYLSDYFYREYNGQEWQEFEQITATLFNILGFQTVFKGHRNPVDRVADFYCYSPGYIPEQQKICLVVDAKNQNNYFIKAEDERAMKEYISEQKAIVKQKQSISPKNTFFIFIAKSFANNIESKISEISRETESCGAVICYDTLLSMVERRLRLGCRFGSLGIRVRMDTRGQSQPEV